MLLAETTGGLPEWTAIAAAITNMGFSAIVAWYLLAKALPGLQEKFDMRSSVDREAFQAALKEQRTDFLASLMREQQYMKDMVSLIQNQQRGPHA